VNPRPLVRGVVATTMLATGGGVLVVAIAYAIFALAEPYVGRAGAAGVVAGLAALGLIIGGLLIGRRPRRPKLEPPPPETFAEKAFSYLKDKPIVAVAAAVGIGILAVRNPQYFGAAMRAFMEPRTPPKS